MSGFTCAAHRDTWWRRHSTCRPAVAVHDDIYEGPAILTGAETCQQVRVLLSGHVDPIDGQYHWQGTVFDQLADGADSGPNLTLAVGERSASARITEQTPQGTHSIAGAGRTAIRAGRGCARGVAAADGRGYRLDPSAGRKL